MILPFARGREIAWDATVCHTCAPTYISATEGNQRAVAELTESKKARKYASTADRVDFLAVGIETLGTFGFSARTLLNDINRRIRDRSGLPVLFSFESYSYSYSKPVTLP